MNKEVEQIISKVPEIETFKVLVSGMGSVHIKKEREGVFMIASDAFPDEEKTEFSEEEAKNKANQLVYKQLANKLEKSIRAENLVLLTGAGTSKECGGPSMADLWRITSEDKEITLNWNKLLESAGYKPESGKENLEELLSNLQTITRAYKINNLVK